MPRALRPILALVATHVALGVALGACASIVGVKDGILDTDASAAGTTESAFADGAVDMVNDGATGDGSATDATVSDASAADSTAGDSSTGDSTAGDASAESGPDATMGPDAEDASDAGAAGPDGTTDAPEEAPAEAGPTDTGLADVLDAGGASDAASDATDAGGCPSQVVDPTTGVFVVPGGSDAGASCGSLATPCGGVQLGLDRANARGATTVYVAAGTYDESISLYAGITLQGGWTESAGVWAPICTGSAPTAVTITAPPASNVTVTATSLGGTATLETMTITSKAEASVQPGESIYGIVATGATTSLVLDDVVVLISAGGQGANGSTGPAGAAAVGTCAGGNGGGGAAGPTGTGSTGGSFSAAGYTAGAGTTGAGGAAGNAGADGGAGVCASCVTPGCSGGNCVAVATNKTCGASGLSGCGGAGGGPGAPGAGGGSSIVLYVWDAQITCNDTTLTAGAGGAGGAGGPGGDGGAGSAGQPGASAGSCGTSVPGSLLCASGCTATSNPVTMDGGAPGGSGGSGGTGGQGGGGAGGWSCSYYQGGAGTLTASGSSFTFGAPGAGGALGGASGTAKEKCP
ncbi:MAG: hypothetical protein ABSE49_22820 [Polyangiaceae bacterium]